MFHFHIENELYTKANRLATLFIHRLTHGWLSPKLRDTMDIKQLLQDLSNEILADEAALSKKRELYELLLERVGVDDKTVNSSRKITVTLVPKGADKDYGPQAESLSESVLKAVKEVYDREFTASDVYAIMVERGVQFNTSTPKASIATALGRLVQSGLLKMTYKGSGQAPNRFLRADQPVDDLL